MIEKRFLARCAICAACLFCGYAVAQGFPTRPIRLVVPLAPGGGGDLVTRIIAQKVSEPLGQPVVVENKAGGSTIIGTEYVAHAPPDGYTLVMATSSHGINPSFSKLPFDPVKDFSGIAFVATAPMILTVHPSVPAKTVKELIAVAKANPDKLNFGSSGTASIVHMAGELLNVSAGIKTTHIPYKGTGPALTDLLSGQITMLFASPVPTIPHTKSGRLRAIAIASLERSSALPDLPTVAESGLPGFAAETFYIILGPANMPEAVVNRLHSEFSKAARSQDVKERLSAEAANIVAGTPQQALQHIQSEIARWAKVVKVAQIKAS